MPSIKTSSLPIDRDSVEKLKEKLLGLEVEDENVELCENEGFLENGKAQNDEEMHNTNEGESTSPEVAFLLEGMEMNKYINTFKRENIDLNTLLNVCENDLKEIGISNADDRKAIVKNVGEYKKNCANAVIIAENHSDDFQIIKNVQNQFLLIQSYCALIECHMKRTVLVDYNITPKEKAHVFFTAFTKAAIKQCELLTNLMYQENSSNHIIGMILKANNLALPGVLQRKLIRKNIRKRRNGIRLVGLLGLSLVLVFAVRKLL